MTKATQPLIALIVLLFVNVLIPLPAPAAVGALMTGKTLALLCRSDKKEDQTACQSYIAGVVDYHHLLRGLGTAPSVNFCLPDGLTMNQMKTVVTNYILARTEHQDFIASPAVAMALYASYPCKIKRRR